MTSSAIIGAKRVAESRVRTASSLIAYWEADEFVLENYLSGQVTAVSPVVVNLLGEAHDFRTHSEIQELFGSIPCGEDLLNELLEQGILVREGSMLDHREREVDRVWRWPRDVRYFHYSTRRVTFQDLNTENQSLSELAKECPPPSPYKTVAPIAIQLHGSSADHDGEFWTVLRNRRTRRRFRPEPVSFNEFSSVLFWTWGKTQTLEDPVLGSYLLKTSPSGGARHPIEVYPIVLRVDDIAPGIYHYSVEKHGLELISKGRFDDQVVSLCADQAWVREAAAVFSMTAAVERSMWKYRHSHAYRVIHLDAGHLGQTFHLVCTHLGLAPFTTAALNAPEVEAALGIDGISEIALYAAATGYPGASEQKMDRRPE